MERIDILREPEIHLEKAVAVTRNPRAEPISLAETRRCGEIESYAGCFMKISLVKSAAKRVMP